jgi:hydrogenase maturation protease
MKDHILVACIGNIFLGDDAFGVEVAQQLAQTPLLPNVIVKDFGIRSYDLAYALTEEWKLVILVDAVPRGGQPGTLYAIRPDELGNAESVIDAHSMNPVSALQLASAVGGVTSPLLVVGCEPATVEADENGQFGLSAAVRKAVLEAVRMIVELIESNKESQAHAA